MPGFQPDFLLNYLDDELVLEESLLPESLVLPVEESLLPVDDFVVELLLPVEDFVEELPVDDFVEELPVDDFVEELPVDDFVEELPVDDFVEELPDEDVLLPVDDVVVLLELLEPQAVPETTIAPIIPTTKPFFIKSVILISFFLFILYLSRMYLLVDNIIIPYIS